MDKVILNIQNPFLPFKIQLKAFSLLNSKKDANVPFDPIVIKLEWEQQSPESQRSVGFDDFPSGI